MAIERLSNLSDWGLVHSNQDIRGHDLYDANGEDTGHRVDDLIVDTDRKRVTAFILDDGSEHDAGEIEVDDRRAYLKHSTHGETGDRSARAYGDVHAQQHREGLAFSDHDDTYREHHRSTVGESGRDYKHYEPAYRHGHEYGAADRYEGRDYEDVRPDMRRDYEQRHGEGTYADAEEAVRHAFRHSRKHRTTT